LANRRRIGVGSPDLQHLSFLTFGEDHHERMLDEQHIFPLVRKQAGELQRYADILTAQHNRGCEITDDVLAVSNGPKIGAANVETLAKVFESFVLNV
jgi:hypothetical protein